MEDCEEIRCEKDGYFDLDSIKPYSSIWVSTRRDGRSKPHHLQEDEMDAKKNVMPSKACNNLHSLLENTDGCLCETSNDEIHNQAQLLSTKSDHFPLNSYKIFEKVDNVSIRRMSDRILESMCKSESKHVVIDSGQINYKKSSVWSKENQITEKGPEPNSEEEQFKEAGERDDSNILSQKKCLKNENQSKETVYKEPSKSSYLGGGEPQEDISKQNKLLTENGTLVAEINLATLTLKDQTGQEYPVTVKYLWETDKNEILNNRNTLSSSPAFIKMVELVSSLDLMSLKNQVLAPSITVKTQQWKERSKSQSCYSQKRKRLESVSGEEKYTDGSNVINGIKGGTSTIRKNTVKDPSLRYALLRSKVSVAGTFQDKKILDINEGGRDRKVTEGNRENSKFSMADRRISAKSKTRIPVKNKIPTVDEMKMLNNLVRPATFNRRELAPRPALKRPPSAPPRELSSRIPHKINIHDSGDKLHQPFYKRSFAGKSQPPNPASSNKCWK